MAAWFTDGEDQALALLVAENEEQGLVWDVICSKFYERTGSNEKSRRQIQERFRAMKRSEVGQNKLKAARENFEAAQALLELAAGSRV